MKKYLLILLIFIVAYKAKAQYYGDNRYREDTWHVTVGPDIMGIINPLQPNDAGKLITYSRLGYGGQLKVEYYPNSFIGIGIGSGFQYIPASTKGAPPYELIPFKVGAKAFFTPEFYLLTDVGLGHATPSYKGSTMTKIVAPGIGYSPNDSGIDIYIRYEVDHNKNNYLSMFGIHIAYSFDLTNGF